MKWEKSKAAVRPFTYTYAMWTRKKPAPCLAIPGTSFSKLLAAEPLRQALMHTGPIKINFDPRLFSQVVKDRPFYWPVSGGLSVSKAIEIFNNSGVERTHCPSPPGSWDVRK